jgi:hypothetical protein
MAFGSFPFPYFEIVIVTKLYGSPCHHGTAPPRGAVGGDSLQLQRAAVNVLYKQS